MFDDFQKVRAACDFQGVLQTDASVTVKDGFMMTRNSELVACHPVKLPDFAVPAVDLDKELRAAPDAKLSVTETGVMLKSSTGNTRIAKLVGHNAFHKPAIKTTPLPPEVLSAFDEVYPFTTGDKSKPWSMGARVDAHTITATNSMMLIRASIEPNTGLDGITLSRTAIGHIRKRREDLVAWGSDEKMVLLEFNDGGWAIAMRLNAEMPASAVGLVDSAIKDWTPDTMQVISPEYRSKLLSSIDRTEELLTVWPDHIYGARLASEHKCPVETKLSTESALFTASDLAAVISVAARVGFDRYPAPVPFISLNGARGLIAGRRQS